MRRTGAWSRTSRPRGLSFTTRVIPILHFIFKGSLVDPRLRASNERILVVRVPRAGRRPGCLSSASLGQEWAGPIHSAILRRKETIAMKEQLTAVFQQVPEGYIAFVEELPGANTQGDTLDEARTNLQEAVHLVLESNRALAEESLRNKTVIREPLASIS